MRCLTDLTVTKYVEGSLPEGERECIDEHLSQCVRCSQRVRKMEKLCSSLVFAAQTIGNNPTSPHPDDNEVAAYVEGSLQEEDRYRIQAHLLECRDCLEGIRILRQTLREY